MLSVSVILGVSLELLNLADQSRSWTWQPDSPLATVPPSGKPKPPMDYPLNNFSDLMQCSSI